MQRILEAAHQQVESWQARAAVAPHELEDIWNGVIRGMRAGVAVARMRRLEPLMGS